MSIKWFPFTMCVIFELNIAAVFSVLEDVGVVSHDVFTSVLLADIIMGVFFRQSYAKQTTVDAIQRRINGVPE